MARQEGTSYITVGGSRKAASLGGMLTQQVLAASTVTTGSDVTLATYVIPANTLNVNGKGLRIRAYGLVGATATDATLKVFLSVTNVGQIGNGTNANFGNFVEVTVLRASATTLDVIGVGQTGAAASASGRNNSITSNYGLALSGAAAITVVVAVNQATASNFTLRGLQVEVTTEGAPE